MDSRLSVFGPSVSARRRHVLAAKMRAATSGRLASVGRQDSGKTRAPFSSMEPVCEWEKWPEGAELRVMRCRLAALEVDRAPDLRASLGGGATGGGN